MNEQINDGGPAFPSHPDSGFMDGEYGWRSLPSKEGMSLRTYLASKAMQGYIAAAAADDAGRLMDSEEIARHSVAQADALLAALHPQPEATLPEHKEVK